MHLIANRTQKLCGSAGTAIAFVNGEDLEYKIAIGIAAGLLGYKTLIDASFCFQKLRSQQVVESDTWQDIALRRRVLARSILTVPIQRNGTLAGCLQLFSRVGEFSEDSIYTCELMSEVLSEAIGKNGVPDSHDTSIEAILKTEMDLKSEGREQVTERIEESKNGLAPNKPDLKLEQLEPQHASLTAAVDVKAEISERPQPSLLKPKLLWPMNLEPSDRSSEAREEQTQGEVRQHRDPSIGSAEANVSVDQKLRLSPIGNTPQLDFQSRVRRPQIWTRLRTIVYPALVIVFVAFANIRPWARGWPLELATIIMVAFTAAELAKDRGNVGR